MKRFLIGLAAILFLFPLGYWPLYQREQAAVKSTEELRARLTELDERLRVASLQSRLGLILIDVEHGNFGKAAERSTKFFDDVRGALMASRSGSVRKSLETILSHRDEVTANLTGLKPGSADVLRRAYEEFAATDFSGNTQ